MAKKTLTLEDVLLTKDEIPYEVPENWCWTRLKYIAKFKNGYAFKSKDFIDKGLQVIRMGNLYEGQLDLDRKPVYIDENVNNELIDKYCITNGDILLTLTGTKYKRDYGYAVLIDINRSLLLNQRILSLKSNKISNKYLYYYLKSEIFRDLFFLNETGGVNQGNVSSKYVENIAIPLPTLAEQERIVNRIESLFEKVDKASELVEESREGFEKRRAAIFEKAFSGELTKNWRKENNISNERKVILIKDVLNPMTTKKPNNIENKIFRYIDIDAIDNKKQEVREPKVMDVTNAPSRASREVRCGDTLFSLVRPYLKNIAYINEEFSDCIASTGFYVCRPNENILPKYLYNVLCSDETVNFYTSMMKGDNSPSIRKGEFESLNINLPSIEEQKQIIKIIDRVLENERKIEELCEIEKHIELIKKSILAKAFRGKLGSNNLSEESSIELLKEIIK